jgi:uncharacterized membrane protein YjjP (DUF1212 family)
MQPMEMALDAALLVMRNGGSTVAADRCFTNVLKGYGEKGVAAVWRLDFIAATRLVEGRSSTVLRFVGPVGANLVRASETVALGERVANGEVSTATLGEELERIEQLPSPHARWVKILIAAAAAGCFSRTAGGDWGSLGIAVVAAGAGQSLRSLLQERKRAVAPVTLACGVLSALIASVGLSLGFSQVEPATMIAAVAYMFPGLPLINGFVDLASHRYLMVGVERIMNAASLFLILGIALAFAVTLVQ